jgi:hypothetical protein
MFTRLAMDALLYRMIGGDDAFHFAICLLISERARRLMEP